MTAEKFKISTSSIKKYINDDENLQSIDIELYNAVKQIQDELQNIGHYVGGKNGKRQPKYSDFEAMEVAETMLEDGLTISEASKMFDIPSSTLYERIRSINDEGIQNQLNELFEINKNIKK